MVDTPHSGAESEEELRRRLRELSFLERIVRATAATVDHRQLLRTIVDETTEATGTQVCSLYLWDESEKLLTLTATNGLSSAGVGNVKLGLGEGVTGWVAAAKQPLAVPDWRVEPRFKWVPNLDQERFASMLSVPILSQDRVVGVINVQTVEGRTFSQDEIDFFLAIAAQVAGIIELSNLHDQVARQLGLERQAVKRLTALNASKSDLLSMLSHDFRGPLAIAKSYTDGLKNRLAGEALEACNEIESEILALERMVDNVMLSLRLEAQHELALDLETFDLVELIRDQSRRLNATSPKHAISVASDSATATIVADRAKIQSVVMNLLGNAVKYSPDGGPIAVRITQSAASVEVQVEDSGIGIDQREADSLFDRYGRGGTAMAHGIAGYGLGLFICKQIVDSHGGQILAHSLPKGSLFAFTLPREIPGQQVNVAMETGLAASPVDLAQSVSPETGQP